MTRKVCIYTSTRADYGLLKRLLSEIRNRSELTLQLLVSGTHLSPEFGATLKEILADGFSPDETVEMLLSADTPTAICKSMGLALIGYGEAVSRLRPDMAVVLGDRFETFCMASACQVHRIPIAHIHGGETTEGAMDEAFRHAITKLSHLHFTSCEAYRDRVVQLGEAPESVFNVGALGVENLHLTQWLSPDDLARELNFDLSAPFLLITFHPVTLEAATAREQFQALLDAVEAMPQLKLIFTKANADTDGRVINRMMEEYAARRTGRCLALSSMGTQKYLSAMKYAAAVLGNSSSGIIEAPSLNVPTVNIGDRQKGRIQAPSIINTPPETAAIREALEKALSPSFRKSLHTNINPYDRKGTCSRIVDIIGGTDIAAILKKKFYDLGAS